MKNLTKTDLENLAALPTDRWFDEIDAWPAVKRTHYSLCRLVKAGYVEKKIGDGPFYHPQYRKLMIPIVIDGVSHSPTGIA